MVHLAPDSRLLVSLVKQEQAYAVQIHNLLNASGTSLSALAVYASSSPPTVSPILNGVAGALSGADEAFRTYGEALNDWIDQLGSIKRKEEEVANIGRDREILVTRLLKASQKSKSPPPSLLHAAPDPSSSTSFPTFNSKITAAQTELQACEAHLAEKERELERIRTHAIRQGLKVRCSALVRCGWEWGEMGRRALAMLDGFDGAPPPSNGHVPEFFKPLPDPTRDHDHDSALSSLSPSQSASQIGVAPLPAPYPPEKSYSLDIPPPHLVSDHHVIPKQRAPEPEGGGSSEEEEEGPVEVHENPRFQPEPILNRRPKNPRQTPDTSARSSPVPFPSPSKARGASSDIGPPSHAVKQKREREKKHTGLFGSLAALFRTSMTNKAGPSQNEGQWSTRTERNLRSVKSEGEQSSDEEEVPQPRSGRLRKGKNRAPTLSQSRNGWAHPSVASPDAAPPPTPSPPAVKKRKSGGKLSRSGTTRSTISEPGPAPRPRANTLGSSSGAAVTSAATAQAHGRTASMDGRWGLAGVASASDASPHNHSSTSTWKPPKPMTNGKGDSLMSIVEGVTRTNQAARAHAHDDPSSRLEVVRAPGSSVPRLPLLVLPPPPLPGPSSAPASPKRAKLPDPKRASMPVPPTPALHVPVRPLRSALRNSNRDRSASPSPSPAPSPNAYAADSELSSSPSGMSPLSLPAPANPTPAPAATPRPMSMTRPEIPSTIIESPRQSYVSTKTDDSVSISSYETGHENFDDDEAEPEPHTPIAPPPPPASEKAPSPRGPDGQTALNDAHANDIADHELSSTDTATGIAPARRKSVRMSTLPPQISATPPALDEYDDMNRSPWGPGRDKAESQARARRQDEGWNTRIPAANVGWDDSSDEDAEYKAARQALSRADRRSERNRR